MLVVTGGAGFIGSALVWALNERGRDDILIVDTLGRESKWKNLRGRRFMDIVAPDGLADRLYWLEDGEQPRDEIDAILHMGAITDTSATDADELYLRNTSFTRDLAYWSLQHGARFIYASSGSVYGDGALGFSDADALTPSLFPLNPY